MKHKYIIVVGCGRLGTILVNRLSVLGHSIVIIDNDPNTFEGLSSDFSGFTIEGDATEISVLQKAKVDKAELFLAVTDNDNINLMVAQIAKNIFKVPKVMARVYDPKREIIYKNMNISTICPIMFAADEFIRQTEI
jgi:trk system potassium uptake protein TrkA